MRCKVKDCENYMHQGWFIDFLCAPCHNFLSTGEGTTSQLYRNTVAAEREAVLQAIEAVYMLEEDRNSMFSDGYKYALDQIETLIKTRGQR